MMAETTFGGHEYCDKKHGAPCSFCKLSALQMADRFATIVRNNYTPRELSKINRRTRRKMGPYTGEKPNGN